MSHLRSVAPVSRPAVPDVSEGMVAGLMRQDALRCVFQPIADLRSGAVFAHEALVRGPRGSICQRPDLLFDLARREGLVLALELHCLEQALRQWGALGELGRLFVNISADALVHVCSRDGPEGLVAKVRGHGILPRRLVLEITEQERVTDMTALHEVARALHAVGIALALDDFGDGRSSLRLWSELKPAYVKIDKYFLRDLASRPENLQVLQAMQALADLFGASLIAEGVENGDDLRALRDLNVPYGQGFLLGHPLPRPDPQLLPEATQVLQDRRVSVLPCLGRPARPSVLRSLEVIQAPVLDPAHTNNEVSVQFLRHPHLHALAVVDGDRPLALINREQFLNHYATLYFRDLHGRKSCLSFANRSPRLIELGYDVEELLGILTSQDQRYLKDGFIVTENGRYVGLGTGEQLVRSVTEARIEAARHANPLTFLPGNIPISQHIVRLLDSGGSFVACYADLNHFKPFNDLYGYWRGDEMIRLVARLCVAHCDPQQDFVGHVGGDDFILLFQSNNWQARAKRILTAFAQQALALYDDPQRLAGGILAEDRHGVERFFPCTTLSMGAVMVEPGRFQTAEQVASEASLAKHEAKASPGGWCCRDFTEKMPKTLRA